MVTVEKIRNCIESALGRHPVLKMFYCESNMPNNEECFMKIKCPNSDFEIIIKKKSDESKIS